MTIKDNSKDNLHNVTIYENDNIKIFEGLKHSKIIGNQQLLEMLELNAEQLTYYLEDVILENSFIDLEYSIEQQIPAFERFAESKQAEDIKQSMQSLDTYLFEQIMLYRQTEIRDAMVKLLDYLDERGYLPFTIKELAEKISMPEIITLDAVTLIKQLEPAGIGAFDLQESMMIQTEQDEHAPAAAYYLLTNYFNELNDEDYTEILSQTNLTLEEIKECVNYFYTLRTNPAALFDHVAKINLIPDITIKKSGNDLSIRYNRQYYPKISFNQKYYEDMLARNEPSLTEYVVPLEKAYQTLADNLRIREHLMLEIMRQVVYAQLDFFSQKTETWGSLSIREVAKATRLPEPIVYRIITNKNIEFNGYVYAFKDFINVSESMTREGLKASYIKDRINEMIDRQADTISNETIIDLLAEEKIIVSEQIVANYRENLGK